MITRPCRIVTVTPGKAATPTEPRYDDFGEPVVEDDMGQVADVETYVDTVCELQQTAAKEVRDGGIVDVQTWSLFLRPGERVSATSTIVLEDGRRFTVDGGPWDVRHPRTGRMSHVEAVVRLVK